MAWKGTEEVFLACYTLVNIDINDKKIAQEMPQLNSKGQSILLAHFENYSLTTRKPFSRKVLKMYLQSPVMELYKSVVNNVLVTPKRQSILQFFQQMRGEKCSTLRVTLIGEVWGVFGGDFL